METTSGLWVACGVLMAGCLGYLAWWGYGIWKSIDEESTHTVCDADGRLVGVVRLGDEPHPRR